jgi:hypothetical protein
MLGFDQLAAAIRGRAKPVLYAGTLIALAGAGTASAATIATAASPTAVQPASHTRPLATAHRTAGPSRSRSQGGNRHHSAHHSQARHGRSDGHGAHGRGHSSPGRGHAVHRARDIDTWNSVQRQLNWQTNPAAARHGKLPAADKLLPVATSGAQNVMPITPAQYANATTIVRQALARRMGLRSAVVAVATAMQESRLVNVSYGTGTSLGLFQQEPNMGWGSSAQVMNPAYAAGAFLNALHNYQAADPFWAAQPLYEAAQGVQRSAFPYAYAQWEAEAAQLVKGIAIHLR